MLAETPRNKRVLLAALAHPDDETFGMGGTLAMYARQGVEVHLICATRGEVGEMDERYMRGFKSIAERRESELRCAAELLGIKEVHFLNYRDSGMLGSLENLNPDSLVAAPLEQVAADVAHYIRLLHPQVVVTFDPIGGYRHPDHISIHQATVRAFYSAADPSFKDTDGLAPYAAQKLYFHTMPSFFIRTVVKVLPLLGRDPRKFGQNQDVDLLAIASVRFPIHTRIDYRPVAKIRDEASACHASQGGGRMAGGLFGFLRRTFASDEGYMRAYPPVDGQTTEHDLFDHVKMD